MFVRIQKIKESKILARAENRLRTFLSLHQLTVEDGDKERPYFMVTRGDTIIPREKKRPDAVVIVGLIKQPDFSTRLVVTNEYRPAIGDYEIGFPAGLIDTKDYIGTHGTEEEAITEAAKMAAKREFFEETGLEFEPTEVSAPNLYSSAGMTDESVMIVFGEAQGTISKENLEEDEEIHTMLCNQEQMKAVLAKKHLAFSKVGWPFMRSFAKTGTV